MAVVKSPKNKKNKKEWVKKLNNSSQKITILSLTGKRQKKNIYTNLKLHNTFIAKYKISINSIWNL